MEYGVGCRSLLPGSPEAVCLIHMEWSLLLCVLVFMGDFGPGFVVPYGKRFNGGVSARQPRILFKKDAGGEEFTW